MSDVSSASRGILIALSACSLFSLAACHDVVSQPTVDEQVLTELRLHQYQWEQRGIHDYRYRYLADAVFGGPGPDEVIEVHADTITSVTDARSDTTVHDRSAPTIAQLFSRLTVMFDGHTRAAYASYDSTYDFPTGFGVSGYEVEYKALDFVPLSPRPGSRNAGEVTP